ncbi:hypothetical protein SAMN05443667_101276 [Flavobacterium gillisiae]|uniref:Uncharacterized protein n=1 Tax=Flavobacterium gillisiae TaxID=150146 RepID=A0A1H3WWK3_9FLAO|nr:hypothetical protein [Flavobacterium gillisiae]SDZ91546.1 hypothetical protein SAMN05443667_101276 [Flavobacterium gillisiae]
MAKSENTINRTEKIKAEYKELRVDRIKSRNEVEAILAKKYNRSTYTIREIVSRPDYPTKKPTKN